MRDDDLTGLLLTSRSVAAALLVFLPATFLGCGGGTKSPATSVPTTAAAACADLHAARAKYDARCAGGTVAAWRAYEDSIEDCAAYARHTTDGKVELRPEGWAACLAKYDQSCEEQPIPYACEYESLHGLVADGEPCTDSAVCGPISACYNLGTDACVASVCVRGGALNEACGIYCGGATPCSDIPYCSQGLGCSDGICVEGAALGEACGGPALLPCLPNLACKVDAGSADGSGKCAARMAGGSCAVDYDCPSSQFCDQGTCAPRHAAGASCLGAPTGCAAWTACNPDSLVCQPAGGEGQRCAPFPGNPAYLTCTTGACFDGVTCSPVAHQGQGCAAVACAAGLVCDSAALTCVTCP
jgi:hypothetical protein